MWCWIKQSFSFLFWFKYGTYLLKTNLKQSMRPGLGLSPGEGSHRHFLWLRGDSRLSPGPPPTLELSSQSHCQFKDSSHLVSLMQILSLCPAWETHWPQVPEITLKSTRTELLLSFSVWKKPRDELFLWSTSEWEFTQTWFWELHSLYFPISLSKKQMVCHGRRFTETNGNTDCKGLCSFTAC